MTGTDWLDGEVNRRNRAARKRAGVRRMILAARGGVTDGDLRNAARLGCEAKAATALAAEEALARRLGWELQRDYWSERAHDLAVMAFRLAYHRSGEKVTEVVVEAERVAAARLADEALYRQRVEAANSNAWVAANCDLEAAPPTATREGHEGQPVTSSRRIALCSRGVPESGELASQAPPPSLSVRLTQRVTFKDPGTLAECARGLRERGLPVKVEGMVLFYREREAL